MEITVAELASITGGEVEGRADAIVSGVAAAGEPADGCVVLAENAKFFAMATASGACCVVTGPEVACDAAAAAVIRVADPVDAFTKVLWRFKGDEPVPEVGVARGAVVEEDASLGEGVAIGANCFVGRGASLGDGCVLHPGVYIGDSVTVGPGSKLYPGVVVYPGCRIGANVRLHAGVVIGADGFGYKSCREGIEKLPHVGTVIVDDEVEIGANSTVDRAKIGATIIGRGTKIDNLVHIAHNVRIGRNCIIVAQTGVAGSVELGDGVTLAAQAGISDHVHIGDGCIVAARGGVIGNLSAGSVVSGFPARDHRLEKRAQATRLRMPELMERLRRVEQELKELQAQQRAKEE